MDFRSFVKTGFSILFLRVPSIHQLNGDGNDVDDSALTVPTDLGNGGNVDLTLASDNGQNLDARDRSGASGAFSGSLFDVPDDQIFPDGALNNSLILALGGFKADTFSMTVYMNDEQFAAGEVYSLTLDDANGTGQNVGTITDNQGSSEGSFARLPQWHEGD